MAARRCRRGADCVRRRLRGGRRDQRIEPAVGYGVRPSPSAVTSTSVAAAQVPAATLPVKTMQCAPVPFCSVLSSRAASVAGLSAARLTDVAPGSVVSASAARPNTAPLLSQPPSSAASGSTPVSQPATQNACRAWRIGGRVPCRRRTGRRSRRLSHPPAPRCSFIPASRRTCATPLKRPTSTVTTCV